MTTQRRPLMGTSNILQLQDNGYKNTVSAISEIIDNSIQANAKNINIIIIRDNTNTSSDTIEEIIMMDDGDGMGHQVFDKALQMSSGTRSNAKSGLGKYGQGLPNSSISQTKRVEVYTKEEKGKLLYNYIDLQEIYDNGEPFLPNIDEVDFINIPIFKQGCIVPPKKGTIVRWLNPNKLTPKRAKTLVTHIERLAGRTYRYYLKGFKDNDNQFYHCEINVIVYDYNGEKYSPNDFLSEKKIKPFDPMFLMSDTQFSTIPTSKLHAEPAKKTFKVKYGGNEVETTITLKLSYCPKNERLKYGRNAGSTDFGKVYLQRNLGSAGSYKNISIIRAGREIDAGQFGFIRDVSDPRERWWSAEIIVDPIIDSIIGIDNKKQQASNINFIADEDMSDSDVHEILKWISAYLEQNLKTLRKKMKEDEALTPDDPNKKTKINLPGGGESEPGSPIPEAKIKNEVNNAIKELSEWIKERYSDLTDQDIKTAAEHALSIRDNHIFIKSDLGDTALYSYRVFGNKVLIEINFTHPFYDKFMKKFEDEGDKTSLRAIRLLIGSLVNAEIQVQTDDKNIESDRKRFKNRMFETLDDYITDLYNN